MEIQRRLGKEQFPLIEQTFYPNHREMVSNQFILSRFYKFVLKLSNLNKYIYINTMKMHKDNHSIMNKSTTRFCYGLVGNNWLDCLDRCVRLLAIHSRKERECDHRHVASSLRTQMECSPWQSNLSNAVRQTQALVVDGHLPPHQWHSITLKRKYQQWIHTEWHWNGSNRNHWTIELFAPGRQFQFDFSCCGFSQAWMTMKSIKAATIKVNNKWPHSTFRIHFQTELFMCFTGLQCWHISPKLMRIWF